MKTQKSLSLPQLAKILLLFHMAFLHLGCGQGSNVSQEGSVEKAFKDVGSKRTNINLSILMDLSDRISPRKFPNATMEYYKRDLGYIKSISEAFINHVSGKKIISIDDRIQTFFDPPPGNPSINILSSQLRFHLNKSNVTKGLLSDISKKYSSITDSI